VPTKMIASIAALAAALAAPALAAPAASPAAASAAAAPASDSAAAAQPRPGQAPAGWQADDALRARLRASEPAIADWLVSLQPRDPARERKILWQFAEDERGLARLRKEDPPRVAAYQQRGRLEREVAMLLDETRLLHGAKRAAAYVDLEAKMNEMLAARDKVKEEQVDSLRRRVAELEAERSKRQPPGPK